MREFARRVHLTYTEPTGWTNVPDCCNAVAEAERLRKATNSLSSPSAADRRTWAITPCDCEAPNVPS